MKSRSLEHSSIRMTADVYGHLEVWIESSGDGSITNAPHGATNPSSQCMKYKPGAAYESRLGWSKTSRSCLSAWRY